MNFKTENGELQERESIVSIGKQDLYLTTKNVENSWHFVK